MAAFGPIRTCLEIGASVQSLCHTAKSVEHGGVSNEFKHLDHPLGKAFRPVFLLRAAFGEPVSVLAKSIEYPVLKFRDRVFPSRGPAIESRQSSG